MDFVLIKEFGDAARFEANTYYTWLRDTMVHCDFGDSFGQDSIVYDSTLSNVEAVVNARKAYIYGAAAQLSVLLPGNLTFESKPIYTEGRDQASKGLCASSPGIWHGITYLSA